MQKRNLTPRKKIFSQKRKETKKEKIRYDLLFVLVKKKNVLKVTHSHAFIIFFFSFVLVIYC